MSATRLESEGLRPYFLSLISPLPSRLQLLKAQFPPANDGMPKMGCVSVFQFKKAWKNGKFSERKLWMANSDLEALSRRELQAEAKQHGIKVFLSLRHPLPLSILSDPLSLPLSLSLGTGESSERRNCAAAVRHLGE